MRSRLCFFWLATLVMIGRCAAAQPPVGSKLPPEENNCATCHGEKDLWEGENARLYVPLETMADDAHWKAGVNCHDCHGGDPATLSFQDAHLPEVDPSTGIKPFRRELSQTERTPAHLEMLIDVCGKCHQDALNSYSASVHGYGLKESGLVVTAVCSDCHGHHTILPASNPQSSLHYTKVSATCAACHHFIQERLQKSVHAQPMDAAPNGGELQAGQTKRRPSCTDCHEGHDLPHPKSSAFRMQIPGRCGECHAELTTSFTRSLHGKLTTLGHVPGAKCSDCHGSHDILPATNPTSLLSSANKRETCAKCHGNVTANFLDFDPHADPGNVQRDPLLFWIDRGLTVLLTVIFATFGLHSILWFIRSWVHVRKHGRPPRPAPGQRAFVRFRPVHRAAHAVLMTSFLGLALTGLPLRYSHYGWAQTLSSALGGFESTGLWHRIFGVANAACLVFYVLWFGSQLIFGPWSGVSRKQFAFGPDSPVLKPRDFRDFYQMVRWFFGLGPKPSFDRWTYWEKFDIWAACSDIILIGSTGFILWFPVQFSAVLPGEAINVAAVIHGKLALLATGFIFTIHFFNTHLRADKFPMDTSILTGLVSEEELEEERPEQMKRLQSSGEAEKLIATVPSRPILSLIMLGGFIALSIGFALLFGILVALFEGR